MRTIDATDYIPFEETGLPNNPYSFFDSFNNEIVVNQPNPDNHSPHENVPQDPHVFANVGFAVKNYDSRRPGRNRSNDPDSKVVVYECDDFYDKIDHINRLTKKNFALDVVVRYGLSGDNYTLTFYDKPKGRE